MSKGFKCKSEAQKRAIAAYYAQRRKDQNVFPTVPNGTVLHSRDNYFAGADGKSTKGRYAIVLDSNSKGDLGVGKVTHSDKQDGVSVADYFDDKSKVLPGGLYVLDNVGNPIHVSDKFEIRTSKGIIDETKLEEILQIMLEDKRFGQSNLEKLSKLKEKK